MSLSKKAYIISAIILTVLTATGAVFFLNIKGKQDEVVTSSAAEKKSLFAVPVDAVESGSLNRQLRLESQYLRQTISSRDWSKRRIHSISLSTR